MRNKEPSNVGNILGNDFWTFFANILLLFVLILKKTVLDSSYVFNLVLKKLAEITSFFSFTCYNLSIFTQCSIVCLQHADLLICIAQNTSGLPVDIFSQTVGHTEIA